MFNVAFAGLSFCDTLSLRKKYPHLELFWSAFSRIRTKSVFSSNAEKCGPE